MLLQTLLGGLVQGCVYSLIALGFVLIYRATRQINFAQGDLLLLGAYLGLAFQSAGLSWGEAVVLSLLSIALLGAGLQRVVLRRLSVEGPLPVILATLALGFVLRSSATMIWGPAPLHFPTPYAGQLFDWQGVYVTGAQLAILGGTLLAWAFVWILLERSRIGLGLRALAEDRQMAEALGVKVPHAEQLVWSLSALLASWAGVLLAPISLVHPELGWLSVKAFAAAVLFGFGNLWGAVLGGVLLGLGEQLSAAWFPSLSRDLFSYVILLLGLWWRSGWPTSAGAAGRWGR